MKKGGRRKAIKTQLLGQRTPRKSGHKAELKASGKRVLQKTASDLLKKKRDEVLKTGCAKKKKRNWRLPGTEHTLWRQRGSGGGGKEMRGKPSLEKSRKRKENELRRTRSILGWAREEG